VTGDSTLGGRRALGLLGTGRKLGGKPLFAREKWVAFVPGKLRGGLYTEEKS
jgi:hypothetical protein